MKLVTAAQMRDLEQRAVDAGTSLDALMEAAGLAVAQEAWLSLGVVEDRRIVVLCGPGNNGSDGLVAARYLAEWGAHVAVCIPVPRPGHDLKLTVGLEKNVVVIASSDGHGQALKSALAEAELVIDALLGIGRARPIDGAIADVLRLLREASEHPSPPQVIAVDLPTGVDADSGSADPLAVHAGMTVTFGAAKVGLYTLPGATHAGRVQVIDIGLPADAERALPIELLDTRYARERLPERPAGGNKGTFGRVLVVAGSGNYPGAARLSAEACYRAGAGLVTIACAPSLRAIVAPSLPEVTYLPIEAPGETLGREAAAQILDALPGYDVLLIGPGLSQAPGVRDGVVELLTHIPERMKGVVVDADALNALAQTDGWHERVRAPLVLTPHPGEMARLLASTVETVQADRLGTALDASKRWGQIVLLKGAHTIVAAPDGRAAISPYANPLLATAGTGDVLAGVIAGLLGGGIAPFDAAACAVYVHGLAADGLREEFGDRGMMASDLLRAVPRAFRTVLQGYSSARNTAPRIDGKNEPL